VHAPNCGVQAAHMLSIAAYKRDVLHGVTRFSVSFTQSSGRQLQMTTYELCNTVAAKLASTPGARRSKACHNEICMKPHRAGGFASHHVGRPKTPERPACCQTYFREIQSPKPIEQPFAQCMWHCASLLSFTRYSHRHAALSMRSHAVQPLHLSGAQGRTCMDRVHWVRLVCASGVFLYSSEDFELRTS
jgi:hypothetical protein